MENSSVEVVANTQTTISEEIQRAREEIRAELKSATTMSRLKAAATVGVYAGVTIGVAAVIINTAMWLVGKKSSE